MFRAITPGLMFTVGVTERPGSGPRMVGPALVLAVAAISFAALFFRQAAPTHPLVISGGRLLVAGLILLPHTARSLASGRLSGRQLGAALLAGACYALHFGTWVTSLTLTSVAASVTLVTATPLLLAVTALATGVDRPRPRHWLSIALGLGGVVLIGGADLVRPGATVGDGLALLGAAAMAAYLLIVRGQGPRLDVWAFSGAATLIGAGLLLGTAALLGVPLAFASTQAAAFVVAAALLPQLVGHGLVTWSLRHVSPTVVGLATVGEPVGATLLAWLWLGETAGPTVMAGCAVTLAAVALSLARFSPRSGPPPGVQGRDP